MAFTSQRLQKRQGINVPVTIVTVALILHEEEKTTAAQSG